MEIVEQWSRVDQGPGPDKHRTSILTLDDQDRYWLETRRGGVCISGPRQVSDNTAYQCVRYYEYRPVKDRPGPIIRERKRRHGNATS